MIYSYFFIYFQLLFKKQLEVKKKIILKFGTAKRVKRRVRMPRYTDFNKVNFSVTILFQNREDLVLEKLGPSHINTKLAALVLDETFLVLINKNFFEKKAENLKKPKNAKEDSRALEKAKIKENSDTKTGGEDGK